MMRLKKGTNIIDCLIDLLAWLGGILIILTMFGVCIDVVLRYFFSRPIFWMVEVTAYSLLYITFLGTAWLLRGEGHVKMDLVIGRLNPRTQSLVNMITSALGTAICLVLTWHGIRVTWNFFQIGFFFPGELGALKWPILAIIPVGSFMLSIQFLRRTYGYLNRWRA